MAQRAPCTMHLTDRLLAHMPAYFDYTTTCRPKSQPVEIKLTVITERGKWRPRPKGEVNALKVTVLDGRLTRVLSEVKVKCTPTKPTVDPLTGSVQLMLTLAASSQPPANMALRFEIKSQSTELVLNMATPQFSLASQSMSQSKAATGPKGAEAGTTGGTGTAGAGKSDWHTHH